MSVELGVFLLLTLLVAGLCTGHPLAFVLMSVGVLVGFFAKGSYCLPLFINRLWGTMTSWELLAVPLFLLMGNVLSVSGIADNLFVSLQKLMGRIHGGVAIAVLLVSTVFAACTGVIAASVITMSILAMPVMLKMDYNEKLAAGVVMSGGSLGILIPPSIMLILFGTYSNVSVGKLFLAAVMPGLLLSALYMAYVVIKCKINPEDGPILSEREREEISFGEISKEALKNLFPPVLLILSVLGSIIAGIATPTEAAALGAFVAIIMVKLYGRFNWITFKNAVEETYKTTAMVLMIIIGASFFTATFISIGGGTFVENLLLSFSGGNKWVVFTIMMGIVFILGMLIDWIGIAMVCLPIFVPIAIKIGFDPLWFLMMVAINLQTSFLTPPFGYAIFYIKSVLPEGAMTLNQIYKSVVPFILLQLLGLLLCGVFPSVVTWLPKALIKF